MMKAFFRHGRKIASFAPSSRFMARKIADGIDWEQAKCIVELGAGTGPDHRRDRQAACGRTRSSW